MEIPFDDGARRNSSAHERVGIMQPYFFPYTGYFSHMFACDLFVLYDNIQYTKKGWINRNRIFSNGHIVPITIPLAKGRDLLPIFERQLAVDFSGEKILRQLRGAYSQAPGWKEIETLVGSIFQQGHRNLFDFLFESLSSTAQLLEIDTPLIPSSKISLEEGAGGQNRVLGICSALEATVYVNPISGRHLYDPEAFQKQGISLEFISSSPRSLPRKESALPETVVPDDLNRLSILDVIACVGLEKAKVCVREDFGVAPRPNV